MKRAFLLAGGIVAAAIMEFVLIFSCSGMIAGIPFKKQATAAGLFSSPCSSIFDCSRMPEKVI